LHVPGKWNEANAMTADIDNTQKYVNRAATVMKLLSNARRLLIFDAIAQHGPIEFQMLRKRIPTPASTLSRIIDKFAAAKMVKKNKLNKALILTANPDAIYPAIWFLMSAHRKLAPTKESAATDK
jgi:DNA-binding transcriptional ArsR family regulator